MALAKHIADVDIVGDEGLNDYHTKSCGGIIHLSRLPRPLQTSPEIRRDRRFQAAAQMLVEELTVRYVRGKATDGLAAAAILADRTLQRQEMLSNALDMNSGLEAEGEIEDAFVNIMDNT